jgi:hypothetical protein
MSTISMLSPTPGQNYETRSGAKYSADVNGVIASVTIGRDVLDLTEDGCVSLGSGVAVFGSGSAQMLEEGNISRQISSAGVSPGATGADNVLAVFSLPASSFDAAGRGVEIRAMGSYAGNTHTKEVKIIVNPATAVVGSTVGAGGTTVADTGAVATNGGGWELAAEVFKYGALNSDTQIGVNTDNQSGAADAALIAPALIAADEDVAILIAVTGNATTTATDIVLNVLEVTAKN